LDEFFLGHFFIDAQVPEKAITTLTRGFPLSSVTYVLFIGWVRAGRLLFERAYWAQPRSPRP
jgi:hypothetical protein